MNSIHNKALKDITKQTEKNEKEVKQYAKNLTFDSQFSCELTIDSLKIPEYIWKMFLLCY